MKIIDLTRLLDPADLDRMPQPARGWAVNLVPDIEPIRPDGEGAEVMCALFGCERDDLPAGEGWGDERFRGTTHLGTHVDAPLHYGTTSEGRPARTIDQIGLDELYVDGIVLDVRGRSTPGEAVALDALEEALAEHPDGVPPGGAVLVRTGQEAFTVADPRFYVYPGMSREGTLLLAERGAKVLGTDALGWDRPFHLMRREFEATGDPSVIWDGHFAGREREVFIVQQVANLAALPPSGFVVGCFPLRLAGCSAAPARVVAFVPEAGGGGPGTGGEGCVHGP